MSEASGRTRVELSRQECLVLEEVLKMATEAVGDRAELVRRSRAFHTLSKKASKASERTKPARDRR